MDGCVVQTEVGATGEVHQAGRDPTVPPDLQRVVFDKLLTAVNFLEGKFCYEFFFGFKKRKRTQWVFLLAPR